MLTVLTAESRRDKNGRKRVVIEILTGSLSLSPIFSAATAPFPKSRSRPFYFRFTRFNTSPLYYLRAWHRLQDRLSTGSNSFYVRYHAVFWTLRQRYWHHRPLLIWLRFFDLRRLKARIKVLEALERDFLYRRLLSCRPEWTRPTRTFQLPVNSCQSHWSDHKPKLEDRGVAVALTRTCSCTDRVLPVPEENNDFNLAAA